MRAAFERRRHLVDFAVGSLARHPTKNLGLVVTYALVVFLVGSVMLYGSAIRREAAAMLSSGPEITAQAMVMGRHDMSTSADVAALKGLRGVRRIEPRLWGYLWDSAGAANYTLMVPPPSDAAHAVGKGEAIVGEGVARARKLKPGAMLFLVSPSGKFLKTRVKSILSSDSALVSSDLVLVEEADFRAFFELPADVWTDVAITVTNPREVTTVAEKAALKLPRHRFVTRADMSRTAEALFSWREGLTLALLAGALVAFAILAFDKASGLSAEERREIGILKAIGWETGDVIALKLVEGGLVSGVAFLVGVIGAWAHVRFFAAGLFAPVLEGWSTLYPRFPLAPSIDALEIATLAALTVAPFTAAILVPVWRTATADPDAVMR
ncbi:MAG: FtsX-like permease family protein [Hyphomicrobiales bacterium]|nr:FtsX-like permease family protein [Hyphomicrobiales bacterium]